MEKWEIAVNKFIKKWENKKYVTGIIICGSYITGNPTKHSDIDIHIILEEESTWRERGNEYIDGILIEYFANPYSQHLKYFKKEYKRRNMSNAHMFITGKVIFDKFGEIEKLTTIAKDYYNKPYKRKSNTEIEISKYYLWDMNDNLEENYEAKGSEFYLVYYNFLEKLFETYSDFLNFDSIPIYKLKRFLTIENDKKKYFVKDFPDLEFVEKYINAINLKEKSEMMKLYKDLTEYVLEKMGGFNIDGWNIRSEVEK